MTDTPQNRLRSTLVGSDQTTTETLQQSSVPLDLFLNEDKDVMTGEETWLSYLVWFPVIISLRVINLGVTVATGPIFYVLRVGFGLKTKPVPFWDISLEKRKQTTIVGVFLFLIPFSFVAYFVALFFLIFPLTTVPMLVYIMYIMRDDSPETGRREPFMRYWKMWRHYANYFPMRLVKTSELPPEGKYVFCYHPHGVISVGAFGNFATDATGFSKKFPGIDIRVLTLGLNFYAPWARELLLSVGMCSASRKACNQILQRGPGSAIMLVVGGAAESLDAAPGTYRLTLTRQGFVRVALNNEASLVPVLGFGETDVFDTYVYGKKSKIRLLQEKVKSMFGFTVPVFHGRGMFNYTFGFLPHRKPIFAVVGPPVPLPKIPERLKGRGLVDTEEGRKIVDECHQQYIKALVKLYQDFKNTYTLNRSESLMIVGRRK